tara:strand:+ start:1250 stop:2194 length:945 start_codon:yes stop_codon:yes gene_type:complete
MKVLKITFQLFLFSFLFSSCLVEEYRDDYREDYIYEEPIIEDADFVEEYDLWYIDYHETLGTDEIPFMKLAFTFSFLNGKMYANNNISGIGNSGNGFGTRVGDYTWSGNKLSLNHELDGRYDFEIIQSSDIYNEIEMYNRYTDTSYFLVGYDVDEFDYDKLFYENIEYLLQDFEIWSKFYTSESGAFNEFDNENYLRCTPENNTTFYSSKTEIGTNIDFIEWSYEGGYEVEDVIGFDNLKILTLAYDSVNTEKFELTVFSDTIVELFHVASRTTYKFEGDYFIQYLKDGSSKNKTRSTRKRTIIKRNKVNKISY